MKRNTKTKIRNAVDVMRAFGVLEIGMILALASVTAWTIWAMFNSELISTSLWASSVTLAAVCLLRIYIFRREQDLDRKLVSVIVGFLCFRNQLLLWPKIHDLPFLAVIAAVPIFIVYTMTLEKSLILRDFTPSADFR